MMISESLVIALRVSKQRRALDVTSALNLLEPDKIPIFWCAVVRFRDLFQSK